MTLQEALEELYGSAPEDFVPTRTRLARAAREVGDRDLAKSISELRKPTVPAWAINSLVRKRPAELDRLLDLGERLRTAQANLDAAGLRALREERERALEGFTTAVRFAADAHGHTLSVAAVTAVRASAVAAIADAAAAEALAGGALVRTLDYAGFGEVDLTDAVAASTGVRDRTSTRAGEDDTAGEPETGERGDAARRRRIARLQEDLASADQDLARLSLVEAECERQAEKAAVRVAELEGLLETARTAARAAQEAAESATLDRAAAADAHALTRRRLEEAQAEAAE